MPDPFVTDPPNTITLEAIEAKIHQYGMGTQAITDADLAALVQLARENRRSMSALQGAIALTKGYEWMAEGRGPYEYDDRGWELDARAYVGAMSALLMNAPRWAGWQQMWNRLLAAEARVAFLEQLNTPYPLTEMLNYLVQAEWHLSIEHGCDHHGYEVRKAAAMAAADLLRLMNDPVHG